MLSAIILSGSILVTHAPGWSEPMITVDMWSYFSGQSKTIQIIGSDTLHQSWDSFNQDTRIGYKVYLPDGSVVYPETMISNNAWSINPTSSLLGTDSISIIWRQGGPAYYTVREDDGSEVVPTSLYIPDPWPISPNVCSSSDSLGRIHSCFVISDAGTNRVCYGVFEPGGGELWRDTIPGSHSIPRILVDGSRVHIVFRGEDLWPDYIQYDLEGNITVSTVSLIEDLLQFSHSFTLALDSDRNLFCFLQITDDLTGNRITLFKLDGETGEILISDKVISSEGNRQCQQILPTPEGDSFYLMWTAPMEGGSPRHIKFAIIDTDGNFIEEPYSAYDYSDEEVQNLEVLTSTTNEDGDIFAIWSQGDVEIGGYWIVMGWFDHNWVGIEECEGEPEYSGDIDLHPSMNPFTESVSMIVDVDPAPEQLTVYDLSGRIVRTLFRGADGTFLWDGCDSYGNEVPAGNYIVRANSEHQSAPIQIVKI